MFDMVETRVIVKLDCASILVATCQLLRTLLSLDAVGKNGDVSLTGKKTDMVFPMIISFPFVNCMLSCEASFSFPAF